MNIPAPPEDGCQFSYVSGSPESRKYCGRPVAGERGVGDAAYQLCAHHLKVIHQQWKGKKGKS